MLISRLFSTCSAEAEDGPTMTAAPGQTVTNNRFGNEVLRTSDSVERPRLGRKRRGERGVVLEVCTDVQALGD